MGDIWRVDFKNNLMKSNPIIESTELIFDFSILERNEFQVKSNPYDYIVKFLTLNELIIKLEHYTQLNRSKHFLFVDSNVNRLYKNLWANQATYTIDALEKNKTVDSSFKLVDTLISYAFTKKETLISIGGGITQDVSAFTRSIYKRGVNWAFIPTTLLAMSDSCIGAKSAINYGTTKNLIGVFSSPREVLICVEFLNTLSQRDILSGFGEIIKLAIVGGEQTLEIFNNAINNSENSTNFNDKLIKLALLVKKSVIEIDEFEENIRKALNYGHTLGHAIEPLVDFSIPHGVAVSIGMYIENRLSNIYGQLSMNECETLNSLILKYIDRESLMFLKDVVLTDIIDNIKKDKKTLGDQVYISVPYKIGHFNMLPIEINSGFENKLSNILQDLIQEL